MAAKSLLRRFEQSIQHSLFIAPKAFRGVIKNRTMFYSSRRMESPGVVNVLLT